MKNQDAYLKARIRKEARRAAAEKESPNLKDARELGYMDREGHAVSMARTDRVGHPTGALTDIGEGRSSAVKRRSEMRKKPKES